MYYYQNLLDKAPCNWHALSRMVPRQSQRTFPQVLVRELFFLRVCASFGISSPL